MNKRGRYLRLLRSLAYDAAMFDRCVGLIGRIIERGATDDGGEEGRRIFASLFPIYFSGTLATIEQRLGIIKPLCLSGDLQERSLGLAGLKAMLEASHFGPGWDFEFGALSRDYGWWPRNVADVKHWFREALNLAEELACLEEPGAREVRDILAGQFRGLWSSAGMYDELERICLKVSQKGFWPKGWIAVRQVAQFDSNGFTAEVKARLSTVEELLRPKDLVQKVRAIVLSDSMYSVDLDAVEGEAEGLQPYDRVSARAETLGREVAADDKSFETLLAELGSSNEQLWNFGRGLALGTNTPESIWNRLAAALAHRTDGSGARLLHGFLNGLHTRNSGLAKVLLDEAVENDSLAVIYPFLQGVFQSSCHPQQPLGRGSPP